MKKTPLSLTVLMGILLLLLSACGAGEETTSQASSSSQGDQSEIQVLAPLPEPVEEPEPEPVYPYFNPLTGEGLMEDISARRPVAVMLNNLEKALPQLGVGQADVIYEIVAEGGITRMMALFQDVEGAGNLGSIRSARDYYVNLACGHDAIYVHAGGEAALKLTVPFSTYKTGYFTYDQQSGQYAISQYINGKNRDYVDGNTGEAVLASNVLVLYTDVSAIPGDSAGRMSVRTTGTGQGLLLRDGQAYPITWQRESRSGCLRFLDSNGAEIPLKPGMSYINLVNSSAQVELE